MLDGFVTSGRTFEEKNDKVTEQETDLESRLYKLRLEKSYEI